MRVLLWAFQMGILLKRVVVCLVCQAMQCVLESAVCVGQGVLLCHASLQGFYTVYSTVFQKLAAEEREAAAAQSRQQDQTVASNLPAFGKHALFTLLVFTTTKCPLQSFILAIWLCSPACCAFL